MKLSATWAEIQCRQERRKLDFDARWRQQRDEFLYPKPPSLIERWADYILPKALALIGLLAVVALVLMLVGFVIGIAEYLFK